MYGPVLNFIKQSANAPNHENSEWGHKYVAAVVLRDVDFILN